MFCTIRQENLVSNFTVFSFFDRKSPDFGKNEGKNSICIPSNLNFFIKHDKNLLLEPYLSLKLILDHPMCFVILKIKQRQHELTLALVPYPVYFGSEL